MPTIKCKWLLLGLAVFSAPSTAQNFEPMFSPVQMANDQLNSHLIFRPVRDQVTLRDSKPDSPEPVVSSPASLASLDYRASSARTKANLAQFVERTKRQDPAGAEKMAQLFASTNVIDQIDQAIRPLGLRATNVADAYTVWWITAWEAVNKRDAGVNSRMSQAVKAQVSNVLLSNSQFASATDAQKQEMAEVFLVQAALIESSKDVFSNDPKRLSALSHSVNTGAMAMSRDLDLTKLILTQDGFSKRSGGRSDAGDVSGDGSQLAATEEGGSNLALYAVAGTGLLAGVFALGKGLAKKG